VAARRVLRILVTDLEGCGSPLLQRATVGFTRRATTGLAASAIAAVFRATGHLPLPDICPLVQGRPQDFGKGGQCPLAA